MPAKLNQSEILHDLLRTLVAGWGFGRVREALESLEANGVEKRKISRLRKPKSDAQRASAVALVEKLDVPPERKALILTLARSYDDESAFPTLSDARAFLLSHHRDARDIKTRPQAFKRILPLLTLMSEKGLEAAIARSRHSGPAELDAISKAIRDAGETMRGSPQPDIESAQDKIADDPSGLPPHQESADEKSDGASDLGDVAERLSPEHRRLRSASRDETP